MNMPSIGIAGMIAGLCLSGNALAYTTWECLGEKLKWDTNSVTMRSSAVSFPAGAWRDSLVTAINRVNQNPSQFRFGATHGDTSVGFNNGQNEVWFTNDDGILSGAPARTVWRYDCIDYWIFGKDVEITEADIFFDNRVAYTTSMTKTSLLNYGGSGRPFQTTAIHELGHGAGLAHTNNTYNIMGQDWTHIHVNGSTAMAYFGEDASNAMGYLYGLNGGNIEDLGVVHWRHTGASGEYSTHGKTRLLDNAGGNLSSFTRNGEQVYRVVPGQTVRLELSYENNGKSTQNTSVGYYLSTNDIISTADTLLGTSSYTLGRDTVYTNTRTLTIPSSVTPGQDYWIGAVVDRNNSLGEVTESNNATYIPIRIN